ncbi:MAG: hypothetical protein LBV45_06655 [Xanthomonadaceae bacterium]|nr:hypothetical protein [Xanthomonadaceae bacterium]
MKVSIRLALIAGALSVAMLTACNQSKPPPSDTADTAAQVLQLPGPDDDAGWKVYLQTAVEQNLGAISNSPFLYYLPPQSDPEFQIKYERQAESVATVLERGVQKDNMLAFGSPASAKMAELIETAFKPVPADTLKGVRILFIGDAADNERVKLAVTPSGADYQFVEAK